MISVNKPLLDSTEEQSVLESIRTGWISSEGPFIKKFESSLAELTGRVFGIAVSNGSAALDIAIAAADIGPGDEVIMPTFTIISPALSVVRHGALPILVDSDPNTWNMDVKLVEQKITEKTKAIIVVHIYGLPVDMDPIIDICNRYNLILIEDAAEMHGQTYKGKACGSFGHMSTFSFYPNKHITTGEGGMILTDDEKLANKCQKLRNLSFEPQGRRFIHYEMGWNYRMTNMQAALGVAQLTKLDRHVKIKRKMGNLYQDNFKDLKGFMLPKERTSYAENIYWVFGMVAQSEQLALNMQAFLAEKKIGTRPFFWCMHEQPVFKKMGLFVNEHYPNAEKLARCGFYLPSGLGLTEEEILIVADYVKHYTNA